MKLGEDLSGGLFRRLMVPSNPAGLWYALAVAVCHAHHLSTAVRLEAAQ